MLSIRTIAASGLLLLASTACAAAQSQSNPPDATVDATAQPAQAETQVAPPAQADTAQVGQLPPADATQVPVPAAAVPSGTAAPATEGAYVPKTEHDNTPWRFDMTQNGKRMSADEFDAWMKSKGVRVATGKPAVPRTQTCPTPEGDRGDTDGDGVINCLDQCPASQAGQAIGPDGCPVPVSIDLKGVTFAYDAATLSDEAKAVLDEAIEILKRHTSLKVEVAGHTDARGDAGYNQRLSERRAKAVYDYLAESGIEASRLIGPVGFGETRPIAPNQNPDGSDNPEGRAKNRRVELNIQN